MSGDDALARLLEYAQMMVRESADDDFHSGRNEEDTDIHEGRERAYRDMVDAIAREMRQGEASHSEAQVEAIDMDATDDDNPYLRHGD